MSKWRLGDQPAVRLDRLDQSVVVRELQFRFRAEAVPLAQVQPITNYRITGTPQETHLGALATSMGLVS